MLTALIVDDEKKICDLIQYLGHWEELGIEVIGTCTDGEDALEWIRNGHPDIVLTDIRMPVYDGLEIIIKAREEGFATAFIVISGYRQFEYAQKALQYGVIDFLVKPIEQVMLNKALEKAVADIRDRNDSSDTRHMVEELLKEKQKREKERFWIHFLSGNHLAEQTDSGRQEFSGEVFQAVLLKTNREDLNAEQSQFYEKVSAFCEAQIGSLCEMITISRGGEIFLLMNYARAVKEQLHGKLYQFYQLVCGQNDIFGPFDLTLGVGLASDDISGIHTSIMTARLAWQSRLVCAAKDVIEYANLNFYPVEEKEILTDLELHELEQYYESFDYEKATDFLRRLEKRIEERNPVSPRVIYGVIERILYHIFLQMSDEGREKVGTQVADLMEDLECAGSFTELFVRLRRTIREIIEERSLARVSRERMPIRLAKEYLLSNYHKEITLERIAEVAGISTVYFSRLFKEVEGKNYIDYLTELRIGAAKKLLISTGQSIKSIAVDTGYSDERYFRKVFKKVTGIKPSDYRKLH